MMKKRPEDMSDQLFRSIARGLHLQQKANGWTFPEELKILPIAQASTQGMLTYVVTERFRKQVQIAKERIDKADPRLWKFESKMMLLLLSALESGRLNSLEELCGSDGRRLFLSMSFGPTLQEEFRSTFSNLQGSAKKKDPR